MNRDDLRNIILKLLQNPNEFGVFPLVFLIDLPIEKDLSDLNRNLNNNDIYIYIYT